MCTIGASILEQGSEFILFKNKDFIRSEYDDVIYMNKRCFGVMGLETWDSDNGSECNYSGFSIGFNKHLACCDAHVRTEPNAGNFDLLVEAIVRSCNTLREVNQLLKSLLAKQRYSWANIVVATPKAVAAYEVCGNEMFSCVSSNSVARTNHFISMGQPHERDELLYSESRYEQALQGISTAYKVKDYFSLISQINPDGYRYNTVYSYIVHYKAGQFKLYVNKGAPEQSSKFSEFTVDFGDLSCIKDYPTRNSISVR